MGRALIFSVVLGLASTLTTSATAQEPVPARRSGSMTYEVVPVQYTRTRSSQRSYMFGNPWATPSRRLPTGRRYYNGRYFGDFNNRFYGPQYGYF